ncbi:AI-2E family transporter [uncultured Bifidobacterium sp.]|uniref:AI-2E family transporter n=1 Tax=uncultured Bifidobacterium sp. TaxID=165187 RepID=UPI00262EB9C8|nr:AI-2E family transporter [uncultured Bifidobacterium sp.]
MRSHDDTKIDLASVFPSSGDPRRPPEWWGRALLYTAIAVFLAIFLWRSWGKVSFIVLDIVIAIFIALAIEPLVVRLVRHGWRRGAAAAVSLIGLSIVVIALLGLFGNMFVQQVIAMVKGVPEVYDQVRDFVFSHADITLPEKSSVGGEILSSIQTSWVTDVAGQALSTTMGMFSALLDLLTVVMVAYYVSAAGPKMRRSLCQWLGPVSQRRFLLGWTVVQDQISGFLFSRTILAAINAACMAVFLEVIHVPSWLPLALFCGITSQFIPTVGTYIGGALPVVFAWGSNGLMYAVGVLVYIVVYQQIENLILSPKISERTMDLNPAVAFLSVLVLGAMFGALGAFLALPVTASVQAILKVYLKRYDLVDSPLMADPVPVRKSKVVEGAEAFSEHVIRPVSDRMPRAAKGSTSRAPMSDELRRLQNDLYPESSLADAEESMTVAIPRGALASHGTSAGGVRPGGRADGRGGPNGPEDSAVLNNDGGVAAGPDTEGGASGSGGAADDGSAAGPERPINDGNPRSRWS